MKIRSWNAEQLRTAVQKSKSIRQVLMHLSLRPAGGNYTQVQKYIQEYKLNVSHFKGKGWSKGLKMPFIPKIPLAAILTKASSYQSYKLKNRLFRAGLKSQHCEICGWDKKTPDGHLPLELDHKNGNPKDNRLNNLQVLCPNCHSLRPNHRGRKLKGKRQWVKNR